jgi:purine nucleosidase
MTQSTAWIIDTDAGVDDAVALLVALQQDDFDCRAITTVAGNTDLANVNGNVGRVLDLLQRDVPFFAGAAGPFFQKIVRADDIMAADGLGGASELLPPVGHFPSPGHAAYQLSRLVNQAKNGSKISLITLGPLTNLALAVRLTPAVVDKVDRLFIMGGAVYGHGNSSPVAEFNFYCDPEAAAVVFNAGFRETWLLPWEVSVHQPLPWAHYERLCEFDNPTSRFFRMITQSTETFLRERDFPGLPLPDLLTAAIAIDPGLASQVQDCYVDIQFTKGTGYGLSSVDWHQLTGKAPNARVVTAVQADAIYALLEDRLKI